MTIKDIAKLAGVSPSTISKIMNNKDDNIRKETREKVLQIVKEYNYTPYSSINNNLLLAKKRVIGILLNNNSYILKGIIDIAQQNHYTVIVYYSNNNQEQELKNITALISHNIDAVIWNPISEKSLVYESYFKNKNIFCLITGLKKNNNKTFIDFSYELFGYTLTQKLIEYRHKNIACILNPENKEFLIGYKKSLFENNLKFKEEFIFYNINDVIIKKIKNYNITGIIFNDYSTALTFYKSICLLSYNIPHDISILTLKNDYDLNFENNISSYNISQYNLGKYICKKVIYTLEKSSKINLFNLNDITLSNTNSISFPLNSNNKKVVVIGSINTDTYLYFQKLPTIQKKVNITSKYYISPGGKGINQSIGIAKLGESVSLIGNVGNDIDADNIYKILNSYNIEKHGVKRSYNIDTGKAYIFVDENGESIINILSGANNLLLPQDIINNENLFKNAGYCLIQSEIPLDTVIKSFEIAHKYNVKIIFKPSSISYFPKKLYSLIDIIIPNQFELNELFPENESIENKAQKLLNYGTKNVIVTLGEKGCYVKNEELDIFFPSVKTKVIDTTGASDAFISALITYLMNGYKIEQAVKIAIYAASFSISHKGVISSLIDKETLENYIKLREPSLLNKL